MLWSCFCWIIIQKCIFCSFQVTCRMISQCFLSSSEGFEGEEALDTNKRTISFHPFSQTHKRQATIIIGWFYIIQCECGGPVLIIWLKNNYLLPQNDPNNAAYSFSLQRNVIRNSSRIIYWVSCWYCKALEKDWLPQF